MKNISTLYMNIYMITEYVNVHIACAYAQMYVYGCTHTYVEHLYKGNTYCVAYIRRTPVQR